ncbi:hypothetical protein LCGC14_0972320 [marine sediment metagenome]|uniref:Uncharacterized protein n=1 Tax=marine sediment metagenome TaxID=412755 RepID=A0A0F9NXK8_9ZZZZ
MNKDERYRQETEHMRLEQFPDRVQPCGDDGEPLHPIDGYHWSDNQAQLSDKKAWRRYRAWRKWKRWKSYLVCARRVAAAYAVGMNIALAVVVCGVSVSLVVFGSMLAFHFYTAFLSDDREFYLESRKDHG